MKKLILFCLVFVFSSSFYAQDTKAKAKTTKAKTEKVKSKKEVVKETKKVEEASKTKAPKIKKDGTLD